MKIHIFDDIEKLTIAAAEKFIITVNTTVRTKNNCTVVLSGGTTPQSLYSILGDEKAPFREQVPWEKIDFFIGDERHIPPNYPDSNFYMVNNSLFRNVPVLFDQIYRIQSENPEALQAAEDYEQVLSNYFKFGENQIPRFDIVLLGLGHDGHTASLFPGSNILFEKKRLVVAPWVEKLKSYRITLTVPVFNNAANIIFIVAGENKAEALREVLKGDFQPEKYPAQLIKPNNGSVLWLVDKSAARLLN
ncbi:MAG: 6-phosphogluconolactonase [Candidatus Schekmanbacteria bacterium RBG_13_48_7]|uniref:6-phosphogluconolactonase n=1 Tax=Candidatus Schekmanbacteria bacterium RBG_13_48_7 TaxID=1817878 RepID=A0A1F7S0T1_9BACT|nr:MAG: 6-phosphogluconolactonase [Candidatus Schekmanbacteria bacterium RBG_13_48_7]